MNGRAASIRWSRTARRPEHHAALAAQRLGQRRGHHHVGRTGQADLVQQPAPAAPAHAEAVRLVDDQQRAVAPAHVVQRRAAGRATPSALNTESVTTTARSSSRAAQRGLDGGDVAVRRHHHPGPRQPAGVDQRRVGERVGHQQRSRPGQRDHRAEVGGVARGEHQRRLGADEIGQRGLEAFVQFGVAGDQPRSGRAGAPGAQRLRRRRRSRRGAATGRGSRWTPGRVRRRPAARGRSDRRSPAARRCCSTSSSQASGET